MRARQAREAADAERLRLEKEARLQKRREVKEKAKAKERAEREATRRQKEQDAIDDFKFKSTNANLDEFSKEHYLQKPITYKQEGGGRLYLNRRDPNDRSKGMNHFSGGYDRDWHIKVEEEFLRSSIGENKGKDFDDHAKRLGRLFGQGTDSEDIALHALDIEKRAVKLKLKEHAEEEENKRKALADKRSRRKKHVEDVRQQREISENTKYSIARVKRDQEARLSKTSNAPGIVANKNKLPISTVMHIDDHDVPGGRFFVGESVEPYKEPLWMGSGTSAYDPNSSSGISLGIGSQYSHSSHAMNQHSVAPNSPSKWPNDPRLVYNGVVGQKEVFSLNSIDSSVHRLPTSIGDGRMSSGEQDASVASFSVLDYKSDKRSFPKAVTSEVQHCSKSTLRQQLPPHHNGVPSGSYSLTSVDQSILSPYDRASRQEAVSVYPQAYGSLSTYNRGSSSAGSLSTLQNTLVQCGHLSHADALKHDKERKKINNLLKEKKKMMKKHSIWLQHADKSSNSKPPADERIPSHHLGTEEHSSVSTMTSHGASLPTNRQRDLDFKKGLVSDEHRVKGPKLQMENGQPFPRLKDLIRRNGCDTQSYSSQLADHLTIPQVEANPFRDAKADRLPKTSEFNAPFSYVNSNSVRGAKHEDKDIVLSKRNKDKRIYGRGENVKKVGEFTAIITSQDPRDNHGRGLATVKKEGVIKALTKIAKSALFAYDTRIVETGALLMALQDSKNKAPGLASALHLHRRFVDAASTNPNTWLLHTRQMILVLNDVVPWLGVHVANRLMAAYDPKRSGVVRYIRVSCSVIAGSKPAMMNLMADINPEFHSQSHPGELFLLRLMLSMYEECDGFQENVGVKPVSGKISGKGIRIEDIIELLSCCCCSIDDQIRMADHGGRVAQHFFDIYMNADISFDPNNTKKIPLGVASKAVRDTAFETAAKNTDKPNPDKYGPYSVDATKGQQMAIATGGWEQGTGGSIVKENDDDPHAPELALDYYGRLTKSAALKERHVSMSAKFGLPLPTSHLEYLNEEKENEERRARLGMEALTKKGGGADSSMVSLDESHSLFLGGESVWSDTSAGLTKMEENIRADGKMTATKFLNHKALKGIRKLPLISQEELLEALSAHFPEVLDEFGRQIKRFRDLIKPYALHGSVTFEDSVAQQSSYGTRMTDKKDMVSDLHTPRGVHEQSKYDFYGLNSSPDNSSIASRNTLPTFSSAAPPPMKSPVELAREDDENRKEIESAMLAVHDLEKEKAFVRPLTTPLKFAVGERVLGLYIDKWYPGIVEKIHRPAEPEQADGESGKSFNDRLEQFKAEDAKGQGYTYDIRYDDGDFESAMVPRKIQKMSPSKSQT